jgi:hypothetical protein
VNIDLEQPADIPLAGKGAEVHDHEIETDVRDALQVGRDVDRRVRAGQKRVRDRFQTTPELY